MHALVAGGSVGGLAAAIALTRIGAKVSVFERSPGQVQSRGAGIVMQPEAEFLLNQIGSSAHSVSAPLSIRQRMDREGRVRSYEAAQLMTSWDTLYHTLRDAAPETPISSVQNSSPPMNTGPPFCGVSIRNDEYVGNQPPRHDFLSPAALWASQIRCHLSVRQSQGHGEPQSRRRTRVLRVMVLPG